MRLVVALALAALVTAFTVQAQTAGPEGRNSARDEQRQKVRAARQKAAETCKTVPRGDAHRDCVQRELCAQTKDPAKCRERIAKLHGAEQKAAEACKNVQGDARRDCMRREICAQAPDPARCETRAKERAERRRAAAKPSG